MFTLFTVLCKGLSIKYISVRLRSLQFTGTKVLMKLSRTFSNSVIQDCQQIFNFPPVDTLVRQRTVTFLRKHFVINNLLTSVFDYDAQRQLASATYSSLFVSGRQFKQYKQIQK